MQQVTRGTTNLPSFKRSRLSHRTDTKRRTSPPPIIDFRAASASPQRSPGLSEPDPLSATTTADPPIQCNPSPCPVVLAHNNLRRSIKWGKPTLAPSAPPPSARLAFRISAPDALERGGSTASPPATCPTPLSPLTASRAAGVHAGSGRSPVSQTSYPFGSLRSRRRPPPPAATKGCPPQWLQRPPSLHDRHLRSVRAESGAQPLNQRATLRSPLTPATLIPGAPASMARQYTHTTVSAVYSAFARPG